MVLASWRSGRPGAGGAEAGVKGPGASSPPPLSTARGPREVCPPRRATLSLAPAVHPRQYASEHGGGTLLLGRRRTHDGDEVDGEPRQRHHGADRGRHDAQHPTRGRRASAADLALRRIDTRDGGLADEIGEWAEHEAWDAQD